MAGKKRGKPLKRKKDIRDDKGRWVKGAVANPLGRTPDIANLKRTIQHKTNNLENVWDWLTNRLDDEETKDSVKFKCAEILLAYNYGKPVQLQLTEGRVINISVNKDKEPQQLDDDVIDITDLKLYHNVGLSGLVNNLT